MEGAGLIKYSLELYVAYCCIFYWINPVCAFNIGVSQGKILFAFERTRLPVAVGAAVAACEGEGGQAGLGAGCAAGTAVG